MAKRLASAIAALSLFLVPAIGNAVTIFATFEGAVTSLDADVPGLGDFFAPGDPITVRVHYASSAPDEEPALADVGVYFLYPTIGEVTQLQVGAYSFEDAITPWPWIVVCDACFGGHDRFSLESELDHSPFPDPTGLLGIWSWSLGLADSTDTAFDDDSLPSSLSLDDFDSGPFYMAFTAGTTGGPRGGLHGTVTSLSFTIPEPTGGILLLAGLLVLGSARGGGRRSPGS